MKHYIEFLFSKHFKLHYHQHRYDTKPCLSSLFLCFQFSIVWFLLTFYVIWMWHTIFLSQRDEIVFFGFLLPYWPYFLRATHLLEHLFCFCMGTDSMRLESPARSRGIVKSDCPYIGVSVNSRTISVFLSEAIFFLDKMIELPRLPTDIIRKFYLIPSHITLYIIRIISIFYVNFLKFVNL